MLDKAQIDARVQAALEGELSAEEVCDGRPELIDAVRSRLEQVAALAADLDVLFPSPGPGRPRDHAATAPDIDGYTDLRVVGHGGMGVVYAAVDRRLGRRVAIKMLLAGAYATPGEVARFLREASTVARLRHPHIVQVYDVGEVDGRPYFTMELFESEHLGQRIDGTPLPHLEASRLVVALAGAVQAAHAAGVVHRDLKPANVLFDHDGAPKVTDFGVARVLGEASSLTVTGTPIGTPSYMAPEQALGRSGSLGPAVDVYALGAILYEALTGRPPFRAETALETERQVVSEEPASPAKLNPRVPKDLETITLKCLSKDPARRYPSAAALADDLGRFQRGEPIAARRATVLERVARRARRNPTGAALVATSASLVVLAALAGAREWSHMIRARADEASWSERQEFVRRLQDEGRVTEARAVLGRIAAGGSPRLQAEVRSAQAELDVVEGLERIRRERAQARTKERFDPDADAEYARLFVRAGIGELTEPAARLAGRVVASNIRATLVAALDDWALTVHDRGRLACLLEIARLADPDPWRDRVREPRDWEDQAALRALAEDAVPEEQPTRLLLMVAGLLGPADPLTAPFLRRVQFAHPADYWVNFTLAELLGSEPEAVEFYRAALAARPGAVPIWVNLGILLDHLGDPEAGYAHLRRAIELDPSSPVARLNLAVSYFNAGRYGDARAMAEGALERTPADDPAHPTTRELRDRAASLAQDVAATSAE